MFCPFCDNKTKDEHFCSFCGRPIQIENGLYDSSIQSGMAQPATQEKQS